MIRYTLLTCVILHGIISRYVISSSYYFAYAFFRTGHSAHSVILCIQQVLRVLRAGCEERRIEL
ncbi:hypothetical protein HanIR_Chr07g0307041 [Helianthus annuus]|nr:hypothetical protein HanIR_Chr07g0307041 [Helianthus annuus]